MALGLHVRLNDAEIEPVLAAAGDDEHLLDLLDQYEADETIFERACETGKAWDAIASALSPAGKDGPWPARGVIGGERSLQVDDEESWVTYLPPAKVGEVAEFLLALTDAQFSTEYRTTPAASRNPEYGPDEESDALARLSELRAFFAAARANGEHVVFSVRF